MTPAEAFAGKEIPEGVRTELMLIDVPHLSFDGTLQQGQLVVHKAVADEVQEIFYKLLEMRFPIQQIVPISRYGWDDNASMAANNTSAFNCRFIYGMNKLSNHSYGRAIDLNPMLNPYMQIDGVSVPPGVVYDPSKPGTVTEEIVGLFESYGWQWGGHWQERTDYQHFEKPDPA